MSMFAYQLFLGSVLIGYVLYHTGVYYIDTIPLVYVYIC